MGWGNLLTKQRDGLFIVGSLVMMAILALDGVPLWIKVPAALIGVAQAIPLLAKWFGPR